LLPSPLARWAEARMGNDHTSRQTIKKGAKQKGKSKAPMLNPVLHHEYVSSA